ncbi:MAG: FAD/NAD(P)-binding protein [Planctomycetota bacterium]
MSAVGGATGSGPGGMRRDPASQRPLDWVIVGGGLHGVHAAIRLVAEGGLDPDRLLIVDPAPSLFERWRNRTRSMAMSYLRSPAVHNLGPSPDSLQRFAGRRRDRQLGLFAQPYERPALELFDRHCDDLVARFGLAARHLRATVVALRPSAEQVSVTTGDGRTLQARRALLATGPGAPAPRPAWAAGLGDRVSQVLEPGYRWQAVSAGERVLVVGGGMTAVHTALRLAGAGAAVDLVSRHDLRTVQFDTDPGWLGPKFMARFERTLDLGRRRAHIDTARRRGSVTPELKLALAPHLRAGAIHWRTDEVKGAATAAEGARIDLASGGTLQVQRVVLGTGFAPEPPSSGLVATLAEQAGLPTSPCGFPVVDRALRWHPRVHVSGGLAELELGPTARNIAGARRACDRILNELEAEHRSTGVRQAI